MMNRDWVVLAVAGCLFLPALGRAEEPRSATSADTASRVPEAWKIHDPAYTSIAARAANHLREARAALKHPGLSAAVAMDGRLVWAGAVGLADLEQGRPMTLRTTLRIGSTSKALTSAAIGLLHEQDKLDLDAPIQTYVPTFPKKAAPISVRQLAGHQAGIRNYNLAAGEYFSTKQYDSVTESLSIFRDDPLLFAPGTRYAYTTYGYTLISAAIEGASKTNFLAFMQEQIFGPLGMIDTTADYADRAMSQRATFYGQSMFSPARQPVPAVNNSNKWAGGGFLSTSSDLARFGAAMLSGTLVQPETATLLFTPQTLADGEPTGEGYGIGWRQGSRALPSSGREVTIVHHGGTSLGAKSFLVLLPDEGIVVAINSNLFDRSEPYWDFAMQALGLAELFVSARDPE